MTDPFAKDLQPPPLPEWKTPLRGSGGWPDGTFDYQFDPELNLAEQTAVDYEDSGHTPPSWVRKDWTGFVVDTDIRLIVGAMPGRASKSDVRSHLLNYYWKNPAKTNWYSYEVIFSGVNNLKLQVLPPREAHLMNTYLARVYNKLVDAGKVVAYPRPLPPNCHHPRAVYIPVDWQSRMMTLRQFMKKYNIGLKKLMEFIDKSVPVPEIIEWCEMRSEKGQRPSRTYLYNGEHWTRADIARHLGCSHVAVLHRLRNWGDDPKAIKRIIETPVQHGGRRR